MSTALSPKPVNDSSQIKPARITSDRSGPLAHLAALIGYALLSVAVTWPMVLRFTTEGVGSLYFDRAQNIWNLWWTKVALLDLHTNPFHTGALLYPQGADLYFHTLNLPLTLISLPFLAFGVVAAYNFSILAALTLSAYAGCRLVHYLTGNWAAGLVGGVIIGFNPLSQAMLEGQTQVLCLQWFVLCIEFYLRTWSGGRRRDAVLTGLFFALSVLTVGYFEVLLLFFVLIHLLWSLIFTSSLSDNSANEPNRPSSIVHRLTILTQRARPLLVSGGLTALILLGPYLLGAWSSLQKGEVLPWSQEDDYKTARQSADLLSFVVPNRNHWLLGSQAPWWSGINPDIHDYTYLGVVTVALAAVGMSTTFKVQSSKLNLKRNEPSMLGEESGMGEIGDSANVIWFWVSVCLVGMLFALGPALRLNDQTNLAGLEVSLPFRIVQDLPVVGLVRAPQRFILLTYIGLGVLAGVGTSRVLAMLSVSQRKITLTSILALLFVEMPLHAQYTEAMTIPSSFAAISTDSDRGAVLELPLGQHNRFEANRMFYQTAHAHPITSAYLSRTTIDPYERTCSALKVFRDYPKVSEQDIFSPTAANSISPGLLSANGISFVTVYKQAYIRNELKPLPQRKLDDLNDLAARLGTQIGVDSVATTYRVRPSSWYLMFFQLGTNWHQLEASYGRPFRWINGSTADLCLFSPSAHKSALAFEVTSFHSPRHVQVWLGENMLYEQAVPADQALHSMSTAPIVWPPGPQLVRFVTPEGSVSPASLDLGSDKRELSLGLASVQMVSDAGP